MDPLIIDNGQLAEELRRLAEEENRSVTEILADLLEQYRSAKSEPELEIDPQELARAVRQDAYERARRYWRETGNQERLALTDEELAEQFWLFDSQGVPRLKSEMGQVDIPEKSLYRLGEALQNLNYRSGRSDIAARSQHILRTEFADDLIRRMNRHDPDAE